MTSVSCIFLLNLEIMLGTFFEFFCIFIRFIRFTHCSTNHWRVTRTVLHQRLNIRVIHDAVGKIIMQTVSQMENFTGIFSCHEWCCLSGLWALGSLNCYSFPCWLPSRAVKCQPGKKRRFELLWISKSVFSVVWLASFVCESVGMLSTTAINMLLAEQTGLLSLSPKKGLGEPCSPVLLCHAEWVRAEHHQAPLLPSFFYENRSPAHTVDLLLCNSSCGSLALGLRWEASKNIKLYIISLLLLTSTIAVADLEMYMSKNVFSTGLQDLSM